MAKSVLELAVGTGQWDAGLKKAKSALDSFTESNGGLQQALDKESQKMQKFVQMMGGMESTAKTAKGQMNDYKSTIEQLTMQYNRMTDAQKKAIGQDYLQAIDHMKQKYQAVNNEIQEMNRSLSGVSSPAGGGGGGLFSGDKISGMLQVFGGNLMTKAAGMAAGLATELGDAVTQGIELAKQGEGVRNAFERLGRGDILQGLREATHGTVTDLELMKAAVKFNDFKLPVEELGTMLAFAQQKAKDTGQSVDYMVDSIVTGLGRKSLMILDNLGLSAAEIKEKMKETGDMTKAVGAIIREQMAKAGDYVETAADRAAQANVSLQNKMEELGRKFAPVQEASSQLWTSMKIGILDIIGGPLATLINQLTEAGRLKNALNDINGTGSNTKLDRMLGNLRNAGSGNRQSIFQQQQAEIWRYINSRENYLKDRGSWVNNRDEGLRQSLVARAKTFGTSNVNDIKAQIGAAKQLLADYIAGAKGILSPATIAASAITGTSSGKGGSQTDQDPLSKIGFNINKAALASMRAKESNGPSEIWQSITQGANESTDAVQRLTKAFEVLNAKEGVSATDIGKDAKDSAEAWRGASTAISAVGSALSQIEDPAAKVMGTIAQAIATIALTFASSLKGTVTPWDWIAAAAAGTATMISTISAIHSATGYAEGGIVKGNSYSGDNMMFGGDGLYGLNAGELVLTKAQQGSLAQSLQNGGGQTVRVVGRLRGKDIFLSAENWSKSAGHGEFLTW